MRQEFNRKMADKGYIVATDIARAIGLTSQGVHRRLDAAKVECVETTGGVYYKWTDALKVYGDLPFDLPKTARAALDQVEKTHPKGVPGRRPGSKAPVKAKGASKAKKGVAPKKALAVAESGAPAAA